ncbi:type II secretion system F family protein [Caballeronia sp. 15715]|uniref:type II secretion system F family protein n=1 Tax=unclassified Caballeronia TaxID=2646786 RepID=UPI0039E5000D
MAADTVFALALLVAAIGCALLGVLAFMGLARMQRGVRTLDHALDQRAASSAARAIAAGRETRQMTDAKDTKNAGEAERGRAKGSALSRLADALSRVAVSWLDTRLGAIVVAPEDRRLLDRCGFLDANTRARFFAARIGCAALLPLLALGWFNGEPHLTLWMITAFVLGFMLPKWFVQRRAKTRQRSVANELPMFVDLLRLLQGVGLSLDQSLQVMINDFATVLPVLSQELALAHRQFTTGRTREQSLSRLATSYESDDLNAVMRLVVQVDKHGGAVQEPLRQFGDRLRETRRATLRERIGALTVKMTGVMVLTLLPALLIMTAGPGFIAVFHSLSTMHK